MEVDLAHARSELVAFRNWCREGLGAFLTRYPADATRLGDLRALLEMDVSLRSRQTMPGHVTASALIFAPERDSILLIHHRRLGRWLQPGGHVEAGEFPLAAARREVAEEVGLEDLEYLPAFEADPSLPLDIDSHSIPANARKGEPAHMHHDFLYVMIMPANHPAALKPQPSEIIEAAWVEVNGAKRDKIPHSLLRAIDRLFKATSLTQNGISQA